MDTTAGLLADAKNRAELLTSRFTALNDGNPGFSYQGHLSGVESSNRRRLGDNRVVRWACRTRRP